TTGTISNDSTGTLEEISQDCIVMPIWKDTSYFNSPTKDVENGEPKTADDAQKQVKDSPNNENAEQDMFEDDSSTKDVNAAGQHVNTVSPDVNTVSPDVNTGSLKLNVVGPLVNTASSNKQDSPKDMFTMEVSHTLEATHIEFFSDEDEPEVDLGNITNSYIFPTTPNTRIHKDHPIDNVIGDVKSYVQIMDLLTKGFDAGRFQYLVSTLFEGRPIMSICSQACMEGYVILNVSDEAVHKELGDRMERAATTTSSLGAEQDNGSGPRCQDTILGDVNAQTRFEITSKQSNDLLLSRGYTLGSGEDINGVRQLQALVDKKRVIITESSIRRDLYLNDAKGTDCLPTAIIFEELRRIGCSMASLIICLATNQNSNLSKYIFDAMVKHLDGGVKFLMYPHFLQVLINQQLGDMSTHKKIFVNPFQTKKVFANMKRARKDFSWRITPLFDTMMVQPSKKVGEVSGHPTDSTQVPILDQPSTSSKTKKKQSSKKTQRQEAEVSQDETEHKESVLDLEKEKDAQAKEIAALKKSIQRLERKKMSRPTGLKRLKKVGMSRRVESSEDQESLVAPEDASKQRRSIADIDADVEVTLVDETQERHDDELVFDTGVLDTDEMPVEAKVNEKDEQSTKLDDSTAGEAVTTSSVKDTKPKVVTTTATTTTTTRPKAKGVVVQEPSEFRVPQEAQPSISKCKGKGIMIEPEVPLKRKDQIALDEKITRDIQAKLMLTMMEANRLLAERLQSKEREELTYEEKGKLFMELMEKRRKHFAALRA
ncbi:hypothetical protein Tco_0205290, partial [Tanacetum coccineum]